MENEKLLIDARALKDAMYSIANATNNESIFIDVIIDEIDNAAAVDAVEVVHGRWEYNAPTITLNAHWQCSACKKVFWLHLLETNHFKYCPDCGAKMDG